MNRRVFSRHVQCRVLLNLTVNQVLFSDIPNWLRDNQTIVGCIIVGISTVCLALAGILKSKGDKAAASRKKEENAKSARIYIRYALTLLVCGAWTFYGTLLTKHAADKAAQNAEKIQRETNEMIAGMERKFGEKIQAVLVKLNAAKQEDSQKITEEKIRILKGDFSQWAEDFVTNLPAEKSRFTQMKTDLQKRQAEEANKETQRQMQVSGQAYPVFSFAIRFLQESIRAYAKQTSNTNIVIDSMALPENFFVKPTDGNVHLNTNAIWRISIAAGGSFGMPFVPGYDRGQPCLKFIFNNPPGQREVFYVFLNQAGNKMSIFYRTGLPTPDPQTINGEYDISDYESPVKEALQRVIKAQILQLED